MRYRVVRIDDNGNRFILAEGLSKHQAQGLHNEAERKATGHKQTFEVEVDRCETTS